jgi:ethanolamine ammonia-lyase large subunit
MNIMLNYQSTSFHDSHYLRQVLGLEPAPEFSEWLQQMKIFGAGNRMASISGRHALLNGQSLNRPG